jgi:curved DNA-binding protein CbpA
MPVESQTGADERVPRLAKGWERRCAGVTPEEGFLLSRIDGQTPWSLLREIGGIAPAEADECLERWIEDGIAEFSERLTPRRAPGSSAQAPALDSALARNVDPSLDISIELQHRILEIEANLDRSYHELLGISRDASARDLKRAYFALSKEFHPDRYFRKEIGGFHRRLERVFKKIVEAYELLSDPNTRAEIERALGPAIPEPEAGHPGGESKSALRQAPKLTRMDHLARLRARFKIPKQLIAERKARAREFYDAFKVASARGRWLEAASNVRLAIAFDPGEREYKRGFGEVQAEVHRVRAETLVEKAEECLAAASPEEGLRLCEEALGYRPGDAAVNHAAARMALEANDLERAREYAEQATEFGPSVCVHHAVLGKVLRLLGERDLARDSVQEALRLDPRDLDARSELDALRRLVRRG